MEAIKVDVLVIGNVKTRKDIFFHGEIACLCDMVTIDFENLPETITVGNETYDISHAVVIDAPDDMYAEQISVMDGKMLLATGDVISYWRNETD